MGVLYIEVGVAKAPFTDAPTQRLKKLDLDGDGRISLKELQDAEKSLMPLDLNEDEMIAPSELVPKTGYPGAIGGIRLEVAGKSATLPASGDAGVWLLPRDHSDRDWDLPRRRIARKDEGFDAGEIARPERHGFAGLAKRGEPKLAHRLRIDRPYAHERRRREGPNERVRRSARGGAAIVATR